MVQDINAVDERGDGGGVVCNSKGVVVRTDIKWGAISSNAVFKNAARLPDDQPVITSQDQFTQSFQRIDVYGRVQYRTHVLVNVAIFIWSL